MYPIIAVFLVSIFLIWANSVFLPKGTVLTILLISAVSFTLLSFVPPCTWVPWRIGVSDYALHYQFVFRTQHRRLWSSIAQIGVEGSVYFNVRIKTVSGRVILLSTSRRQAVQKMQSRLADFRVGRLRPPTHQVSHEEGVPLIAQQSRQHSSYWNIGAILLLLMAMVLVAPAVFWTLTFLIKDIPTLVETLLLTTAGVLIVILPLLTGNVAVGVRVYSNGIVLRYLLWSESLDSRQVIRVEKEPDIREEVGSEQAGSSRTTRLQIWVRDRKKPFAVKGFSSSILQQIADILETEKVPDRLRTSP
jgi:hypothetical protein